MWERGFVFVPLSHIFFFINTMTTLLEAQLKVNVLKWTEKLCRALEQDYKNHSLRTCMNNQEKISSEYMQERIREIENNEEDRIRYFIKKGKKFYKICMGWKQPNPQFGEDISVHAFVDKETGEVYKPAGWKQPAKHVRFDMRDETQRARLYNICDWAGGYLYMR